MFYCLMGGNINMWFGVFVVFGNVQKWSQTYPDKKTFNQMSSVGWGVQRKSKKSVECSELGVRLTES